MRSTVTAAGRTRSFTVIGEPDGAEDRALVLVFHGSKQDGEVHRRFTGGALDRLATENRAVVVYLDGYRGNWNDARAESSFPARLEQVDDVAFARAVVDSVRRSHRVDVRRVVGVGYSNGGQMVFRLIHDAPDLLTGAVVVAATMPDRDGFLGPFSETTKHPIPVTLVAGTADRIVPYKGGRMAWWARAIFKVGGVALSAPATAEYFARRNGVTAVPTVVDVPASPGMRRRPRTEETTYREPGRPPVTFYTVHGGGHTVPAAKPAPAVLGRTGAGRRIDDIVLDTVGALNQSA
ncbi:alpha/beta hydrolase family esterase [Herbiconiux solani]|uniref:alpha/beta hydrolase family esterase n=1 Tax=Herbiconiux solani TaxID=661329 RepID=UPI00157A8671|nr:PHB depolymerase family esterase [Herbiconiux solani]